MKTYLVEGYSSEIKFDNDSAVVALTPEVCYQLDKAGIKYSIIEDYYDEAELSTYEDEYFKSQLQWIDGLDEFLQENVKQLKELNLKLGTIYYYYFKTMVLDPLYIRCYTLNRLFEAIKPSTITFISHPPKELPSDFILRFSGLRYYGESYYSQIIPILCNQNNIPLTSVFLQEDETKQIKKIGVKPGSGDENLTARLKRTLGKSEIVRRLYFRTQFIYKYLRSRPSKQPNRERFNVLLLKTSYIGKDFVIDALRRGHNVYQLSDDFIVKYSPLGARRHLELKAEYKKVTALNNSIWQNTANLLEDDDLINWINEECQLDVSQIVLPKLKYFISEICPEILGYFKVFIEFYQKDKIDFVITPTEVSTIDFAAVAGANHSNNTKSVCVQHGDTIFAANFWNITELSHFNIYISSNEEIREYFRYQCQANHIPTKLYGSQEQDRLLNVKRINCLREKGKGNIRRNRIIYLPTMFRGNYGRFDCGHYPDTWYYEFEKSLVEYLSTKKEYVFVYKGTPESEAIYDPILNFITDNNFSNIEIATNPFTQHLLSADRVICDYPSTGFYESVVAGVPTMSLYHKAFKVRKSAVDYFGNLLKLYSDIPEAIKHIDEFLNSAPELYKTTIDVEDRSILDILEGIGKKTN